MTRVTLASVNPGGNDAAGVADEGFDAAFQARLQRNVARQRVVDVFHQSGAAALELLGFLEVAVEAGAFDGDRGLSGNSRQQLFVVRAEHAGLWMAEVEAADDPAVTRDHGHGEIRTHQRL